MIVRMELRNCENILMLRAYLARESQLKQTLIAMTHFRPFNAYRYFRDIGRYPQRKWCKPFSCGEKWCGDTRKVLKEKGVLELANKKGVVLYSDELESSGWIRIKTVKRPHWKEGFLFQSL